MLPSFRHRLARRIALAVGTVLLAASTTGYVALRSFLYGRLDDTVRRLAEIEAAATADSPDEHVHFHDELFLGSGAGHTSILKRFAQVWTRDGVSVLRTAALGERNLPLPASVRRSVLRDDVPVLFTFAWDGDTYRAVLYPLGLIGPEHDPHLLEVAVSTADTDRLLRQVLAALAALVVGGMAASGVLGWWLAGYALRPVLEIIRDAETLRIGDRGRRLNAQAGTAEMQRLLGVLNAMLVRIDDALESQRRFIADAGHAIRTPLTILRGDLDVSLRRPRSEREYRETLTQALDDLRHVSALADDLITLARSDGGDLDVTLAPVPVAPLLERLARRFEGAAGRQGLSITWTADVPAVWADERLLERALDNVVDNAIRYGGGRGTVRLSASADGDTVVIAVADDGPGIPVHEMPRVRDRFFRGAHGRAVAGGSGLGLAIAEAIAASLGGHMTVDPRHPVGTTVTLWLERGDVPHANRRRRPQP